MKSQLAIERERGELWAMAERAVAGLHRRGFEFDSEENGLRLRTGPMAFVRDGRDRPPRTSSRRAHITPSSRASVAECHGRTRRMVERLSTPPKSCTPDGAWLRDLRRRARVGQRLQ